MDNVNQIGSAAESGNTFTVDNKNYATDKELAGRALDWIKKVSIHLKTHRSVLDMRYMQYYNIYRCNFDIRFYEGVSMVYIPQLRKQCEQYVTKLKAALFPTDELIDVEPTEPEMVNDAEVINTFMSWQIDKKVKIRSKIDRWLRQLIMYGWSPVQAVWEEEWKEVVGLQKTQIPVMRKQLDPITGESFNQPTGEVKTEISEVTKRIKVKGNPTFNPVDVFSFYKYPVTANSIEDCYGVIHLTKQPRWHLIDRQKAGDYDNIQEALKNDPDRSDLWDWAQEQRLISDGLTGNDQRLEKEMPQYTVVNYWGKWNWGTEEEPDEQDTVITTLQNKTVIQLRKNGFYDKEIPYLEARFHELQNESYPSGVFEPLSTLQYYLNDTANQTFDALLYEINPITVYDPGKVVNVNTISFAPGAMWAVSDVASAIKFDRHQDVSQIGFNAMNEAQGVMEAYPGLGSVTGQTGRRAATHIQAIQEEYSQPIISLAQNIESQVLSPWLKMAYRRNQQFIEEKEVFFVTGKRGVKYWQTLAPEMLVGDYNFAWKGSSQATNIHVKSLQMANYIQTVAPFIPYMAQQGVQLDVAKIARLLWTVGYNFEGGDEIIKEVGQDQGIDPTIENALINMGKYIPTSSLDDDKVHMQSHTQIIQQMNPFAVGLMKRHIQEHQFRIQQQMNMAQQQQVAQSQQQQNPQQEVGQAQRNVYQGLRSQNIMERMG